MSYSFTLLTHAIAKISLAIGHSTGLLQEDIQDKCKRSSVDTLQAGVDASDLDVLTGC